MGLVATLAFDLCHRLRGLPDQVIDLSRDRDADRKAVHELSYGAVTKVWIEDRKRFWNERDWYGRLVTETPIVLTWHATSHIEHEHGILTVYTGGDPGAKLTAPSDSERIRLAVAELEEVFPGSSDLIECTETVAWPNEPYRRASYAAFAPGM